MKHMVVMGIAFIIVGLGFLAVTTMSESEEPDYCTSSLMAHYRNVIISHQECQTFSRCVIEPKDIRDVHIAQINFQQCIIEISEEAQKKAEAEAEENGFGKDNE